MAKINVAVLAGGYSTEWEISMLSAKMVIENLDKERFQAFLVEIRQSGWSVVLDDERVELDLNQFGFEFQGGMLLFDIAFNAIHGDPGENGLLQGYLESRSIPHTSSSQFASALTFNKWHCNCILRSMGFTCADSIMIHKNDKYESNALVERFGLPFFIKPNQAGSSFGVSKVKSANDIAAAFEEAYKEDDLALVEAFMQGTEVGCGVYQKKGNIIALSPTEIRTENEFFDYEAKYLGKSEEITPAEIGSDLIEQVQHISEQVYLKLHLAGVVRIDFIIVNDLPHIVEVNTIPGISPESIVPKQVRHAGISLKEFFGDLIEEALS